MTRIAGKTVLVTGGAMGMGKLFASRCIAAGATQVVLWDIDLAALEATAPELGRQAGAKLHPDPPALGDVDELPLTGIGAVMQRGHQREGHVNGYDVVGVGGLGSHRRAAELMGPRSESWPEGAADRRRSRAAAAGMRVRAATAACLL